MVHTIEILHKLLPFVLADAIPDLLEYELVAVGDDASY
jgi:hypothetical protein